MAEKHVRPALRAHEELAITLPAWSDFGARLRRRSTRASDVRLSVGGDAVMPDDAVVTPAQLAAYDQVFERLDETQQAILRALEADESIQRQMAAELPGTPLRDAIRLTVVHVLNPQREGEAYVGYQFACGWDDEHELGVMTHRGRVVSIGGGDTAFLSWIAKRDGGVVEGEVEAPKRAARTATKKKPAASKKKPAASKKKPAAKARKRA